MKRDQLFHRWLPRQPEGSPAGELWTLCEELGADLGDLGRPGALPTAADYELDLLSHLSAAWIELESVNGSTEVKATQAAAAAARTLLSEEEALRLLRKSWSAWLLSLQG